MRNAETYKIIKREMKSWARTGGLRTAKTTAAAWKVDDRRGIPLVVAFRCFGVYDPYFGGSLTVEVARTEVTYMPYRVPSIVADLPGISQRFVSQHNAVMGKLPPTHPETREMYGDREQEPIKSWPAQDPWLRYYDEEDVAAWCHVLQQALPELVRHLFHDDELADRLRVAGA